MLSGRSLKEMHRVHYLEPGWDFGYCLSWMAMRRGENIYLHHGGGIHGFLTMVSFNKHHRLGVIVLTNMTGHTATFDITVEMLEFLIFEFYQMSNQSGQRSEMLGGCLDHPIHPSRWPDSQYTWLRVRSTA